MKQAIIAMVAIIAAALIYTQLSSYNEKAATTINSALESSSTTIETASLISTAPDNADVFFLEPSDGTTVSSPVTIKFGVTNMAIVAAGDMTENSGHHHILIDLEELPDMTQPLPATDNLVHFGLG